MTRTALLALVLVPACLLLAGGGAPDDEPEKTEKEAPPSADPSKTPPTHRAARGPFRVVVTLEGVLESTHAAEVSPRPDAWTTLTVREAVEHGARVRKGELLLAFETEKLDQAIRDLELELELSRIDIARAEEELRLLERTAELDLEAAERSKRVADEVLLRFVDSGRRLSEKSARYDVESSRNFLDYEKEELEQLEKMYRADDLTEETEEIILRRQRDAVKRAEFWLELAEDGSRDTLEIDLPRREESLKDAARRGALALERARATLPASVAKKKLDLDKTRLGRERSSERLAKLRKDREAMEVRSPADGIVYHGKCVRGRWTDAGSMADKLRRGGSVSPGDVVMTVVDPGALRVRLNVPEKELHRLDPGLEGTITPTGFPDLRIPGALESVANVPVSQGTFDAVATLRGEHGDRFVPGMTCSLKLTAYARKDVIALPAKAVHEDEEHDGEHCVFVKKGEDGHERRTVKVGKRTDEKVEILEGLAEGEEVLLEKPER